LSFKAKIMGSGTKFWIVGNNYLVGEKKGALHQAAQANADASAATSSIAARHPDRCGGLGASAATQLVSASVPSKRLLVNTSSLSWSSI
jgi:hypothetical protein